MDIMIYVLRCIVMLLVTWTGVRIIGKKSIAEMTSYDLAAIMLLTTIAAEPLVYKVSSKATVGVFTLVIATLFLGYLSLQKFFYNIDAKPSIIIVDGKVIEKELKKARMNLPLLMSELRNKGYQNISDIKYAVIEPNGKMSVIQTAESSPITPKMMGVPSSPVNISIPLIIDGEVDIKNLNFLQKDKEWLETQIKAFGVGSIREVLIAQYDSSGQLYVNVKNEKIEVPNIL